MSKIEIETTPTEERADRADIFREAYALIMACPMTDERPTIHEVMAVAAFLENL